MDTSDPPKWHVQVGKKVCTVDEEQLRKKLSDGDLSGLELCRLEAGSEWVPLHRQALYAEVIPHAGSSYSSARFRAYRGLLSHTVSFAAVMVFLGFPNWGIFWLLGLAMHGIGVVSKLSNAQAGAVEEESAVISDRQATSELEGSLANLLATLGSDPSDLSADDLLPLSRSAADLRQQRESIREFVDDQAIDALQREMDEVELERSSADDPHTQAVLDNQLMSIGQRLAFARSAADAVRRLEARERALIHQVEGLRLALLQARITDGPTPDLHDALGRLAGEIEADSEIDEALVMARRAARAPSSRA